MDAEELADQVAAHGLAVPAIGTGQAWGEERLSYSDPDPAVRRAAIERTKAHIPVAHRLDALIIIGLLRGLVQPGVSQAQAMDWVTDALAECCAEAAQSGVRIALEPINRYETTLVNNVAEGLALIDRVGADNLGLLFDTFHANIEEPSIEESLLAAGGRLFHVHVADSNRWYPGAGHLDFAQILDVVGPQRLRAASSRVSSCPGPMLTPPRSGRSHTCAHSKPPPVIEITVWYAKCVDACGRRSANATVLPDAADR